MYANKEHVRTKYDYNKVSNNVSNNVKLKIKKN